MHLLSQIALHALASCSNLCNDGRRIVCNATSPSSHAPALCSHSLPDANAFFSTRASSASAVSAAAERARLALEDPRLTGEPRVEEDRADNGVAGIPSPSLGAAPGSSAQFDMGRAIVQPRMHFSGVHAAAYTYAARVLAAALESNNASASAA